jgi:DNA-binding response OmpR family regulator
MKSAVIVEDDKIAQKYIQRALEGTLELHFASTGKEGERMIQELKPDIILLDIELPDHNGHDICHKLRLKSEYLFTPILFISSKTNLEERINGYQAGGDDYITKPFEASELIAKINAVVRQHEHKESLSQQFKEAQSTAIESMTSASELGLILQFFEKTYAINNFEQLARAVFSLLRALDLKACLFFETKKESFFYCSEGENKPIEQDIITKLRSQPRFFDFGQRTQINYPVVSCLVKNMPLDDPARYGRYKDVIPPILACANQKVLQLEMELLLQEHTMSFSENFKNIRSTLDDLANEMRVGQEDGSSLLNTLFVSLEEAMPRLGLDEDQELYLMGSIEEKINEAMAKVQNYETIQMTFDNLIRLLQHLVDNQEQLVDRLVSKDGLEIEAGPGTKENDGDVEFF